MIRERRKPGPDVGTKVRKLYEHVCPAAGCPREGEPFMGTKKARFCSTACGLRDWRARQKEAGDDNPLPGLPGVEQHS